jgi:hypothetical protein
VIAGLAAVLLAALPLRAAQGPPNAPGTGPAPTPAATRVLRTFDFEERRLGNVEDLPMNWLKVEGPGLPHYVSGRLTTDRSRSGTHSFRLDLDGGSLLYRYPQGLIPVQPNSHYRIECWCQTTVMPNARACLTAYCTDQDGHPIASTLRRSDLYTATRDDDPWTPLGVDITANSPDAAWLVVELGLLQPALYARTSLGSHALFPQDIHATAWFDDVSIAEVPTVWLRTERPGNIFRRSDAPRMIAAISDRFTDDLSARLVLRDAQGREVYQYDGALDVAAAQTLSSRRKRLTLSLPTNLPAGWYEATLKMSSRGQSLGARDASLVVLADNPGEPAPDPRFGAVATALSPADWGELPDVLACTGLGRVKIAVWTAAADASRAAPVQFDSLLERLRDAQITPDAALLALPPEIAAVTGNSGFASLLRADISAWQPQLSFLVARHAGYFGDWQLGDDGDPSFVQDSRIRQAYDRVRQEFAHLVQRPEPAMPWPAWFELDSKAPPALSVYISPDIVPSQIPLYLNDLREHSASQLATAAAPVASMSASEAPDAAANNVQPAPTREAEGRPLSVYLVPLDRKKYGRDAQIADFAKRIAYSLAAGAKKIDVPLPYDVQDETVPTNLAPTRSSDNTAATDDGSDDSDQPQPLSRPQELFLVLRTITNTLSGAEYRGEVPIADGVDAFLFERDGHGILMIWDKTRGAGPRRVALQLSDAPTRLDMWGNSAPLLSSSDDRTSGSIVVDLGSTPIFLLDVDPHVAELRASLALDNDHIESSFEPHNRRIRFTNTFAQTLNGELRLRPPPGWTLTPQSISFSLRPGQTLDRQLTIEFPFNSTAGPKQIEARFKLQAEQDLDFTVPLVLHLGLSDIGVQTVAVRQGSDLLVQQFITNYGQTQLDYTAFAICPGRPRQERLVIGIDPGATVIKKYRFIDVPTAGAVKIRTGLKENTGPRMYNEETLVQ